MRETIERICPCCQELFTLNKYHEDNQVYCWKPGCRKASHAAANRKWRQNQKLHDPLRESHRKRKARRSKKFRLALEVSRWRKQAAFQQMLLLGVLRLFSGAGSDDVIPTLSRCVNAGRDFLRGDLPWEELAESFGPGFGLSEVQ